MTELAVQQADITSFRADVIVNAANSSLVGGGGVDGAIHRAAGPRLLEACRRLHGAAQGEAKMTPAFEITTAKAIVHAVGPIYRQHSADENEVLLASCYRSSLDLAAGADYRTIAFPSISTGAYGYPMADASSVAVDTIRSWIAEHPDALDTVTLIAFSARDLEALRIAAN
ncbi:O-acetyl-ADP-ribose deacetylase [Frondihabitans australicus]|uniref:O-acetyl-ADP-ribose deacetylase (Regulator of RNase III) n=1 Tax=Frondihabitans australicus TaxID=386892 RepID=A0A495IJ46_9MICO|nr:O-acetyl-ADP-ribose deacetylase [Frondihabitans australicus]RKR76003.1 O-acetyl-ADP-ribose deacetylase (regulator of RNase III) [Frondihabitans australicus]